MPMPTPEAIMRHYDSDPDENPWVRGKPAPESIAIVAYDPEWPARYDGLAADLRRALGPVALDIQHIGSTAVPGLPAKPVIDIDVAVADPTREDLYVPALEALGYELRVREPSWHQHRCLQLASPRVNLHVFGPDCPEAIRHRMFRDWLRGSAEDRQRYAQAKQGAASDTQDMTQYNQRKQDIVRDIYDRVFRALASSPERHAIQTGALHEHAIRRRVFLDAARARYLCAAPHGLRRRLGRGGRGPEGLRHPSRPRCRRADPAGRSRRRPAARRSACCKRSSATRVSMAWAIASRMLARRRCGCWSTGGAPAASSARNCCPRRCPARQISRRCRRRSWPASGSLP
ncbi:GrpB family protein [Achromobacter xylosoxidans]